MQVAVLCGGRGLRLNGGGPTPKALAEIQGKPLLRWVLDTYGPAHEFVLLTGHGSDAIANFAEGIRDLRVRCLYTGANTETGGRLQQAKAFLNCKTFAVTYCDGLADLDVTALEKFHHKHGKAATVTAVPAVSKFGILSLDGAEVHSFREKPVTRDWASAGFFVFEPSVFDVLDNGPLERASVEKLTELRELYAYKHPGYFQCCDTAKEWESLNSLKDCPWSRPL
jgi:glucose-1-phosphate cytidylyltransferase